MKLAILLMLLIIPAAAIAQIPGIGGSPVPVITVPGSVESDQPVEANTLGILSSVTTGGGGFYIPNAQFISSLDQGLFSGINAQNFNTWFPGWQALPPDSTKTVSIPMAATVLTTYGQALALPQSQEQELASEDFAGIESVSASAPAVLEAIQANTEAKLQTAQQLQYLRQLVAALLTVETTKAAEEFNERAQEGATTALSFNLGLAP